MPETRFEWGGGWAPANTDTRITKEGGGKLGALVLGAFPLRPRPASTDLWLCVSFLIYSVLVSSIKPSKNHISIS